MEEHSTLSENATETVLSFKGTDLSDRALECYEKAARAGDSEAMYRLGESHFLKGREGYHAAMVWYKKAALNGHAFAQHALGWLHEDNGNIDSAIVWYEHAAENGHVRAMGDLAHLYEEKAKDKAISWYEKAAERGRTFPMLRLQILYLAAGDKANALKWRLKLEHSIQVTIVKK